MRCHVYPVVYSLILSFERKAVKSMCVGLHLGVSAGRPAASVLLLVTEGAPCWTALFDQLCLSQLLGFCALPYCTKAKCLFRNNKDSSQAVLKEVLEVIVHLFFQGLKVCCKCVKFLFPLPRNGHFCVCLAC